MTTLQTMSHSLLDVIRRLATQPCMCSSRAFVLLSRQKGAWSNKATWGDTTLGGSMGVLDMAADLGLPAVLRRGLAAGLVPSWRTHVLAWRSRSPECLAQIAHYPTIFPMPPWPDAPLQHDTLCALARRQARALRSGLDDHDLQPASNDRF